MIWMRDGTVLGTDRKGGPVLSYLMKAPHRPGNGAHLKHAFLWARTTEHTHASTATSKATGLFVPWSLYSVSRPPRRGWTLVCFCLSGLVSPLLRLQRSFFWEKKKKEDVLPLSVYGNERIYLLYLLWCSYSGHRTTSRNQFSTTTWDWGIHKPSDLAANTSRHWRMVAQSLSVLSFRSACHSCHCSSWQFLWCHLPKAGDHSVISL